METEQIGPGETWMEGRCVGPGTEMPPAPSLMLRGEQASQSHWQGCRRVLSSLETPSIF